MTINTEAMRHCQLSHTPVAAVHLTGDRTLRGHCPGCGRQHVPADPLTAEVWTLRPHNPRHNGWTPTGHGGPF